MHPRRQRRLERGRVVDELGAIVDLEARAKLRHAGASMNSLMTMRALNRSHRS